MQLSDLKELHYITPIANIVSILRHGILCYERAKRLRHESAASAEVQDRRARLAIPGGQRLHHYVNLYLCARNPMRFSLKPRHHQVCVLSVSPAIFQLAGVVVTDGNAASSYTRCAAGAEGLSIVDAQLTFAEYWRSADQIDDWRRKSAKCAEVLVPGVVPASYINAAYVVDEEARHSLSALNLPLNVVVDGHLFFR